ncbi:efflux RND transporter permease subunit [Novipirellula artificiosorum]|uniref:MMPL family protein n=1 Tax=Novipirellula artificiosorum TaxID=2528016 RepID=A0A5C6E504_9BACT|nr:MMPL family transporter [Novipirellula artificiosorum]TWU42506.1 MMPL family protein [Novipirellula artificiosorum]
MPPFLERRSPARVSYALLILMAFFFFLPSVFRAARLSLGEKQNNIKDWLPSDFPETAELEWFGSHFVGESFVLATWPGCTSGDQRLQLLEQKLLHESDAFDPTGKLPPDDIDDYRRAKELGKKLELLNTGRKFDNWGGKQEKWVRAAKGTWFYLTPDGRFYRWEGSMTGPASLVRSIQRSLGRYELDGTFVTAFGQQPDDEQSNPFHNDPTLLCAPLFHTVQTGGSIAEQLASEGGPLWPIELIDPASRPTIARRLAMKRLTGTMFAPAVPPQFDWTAKSFRAAIPEEVGETLSDDFELTVSETLREIVETRFAGSIEQLQAAPIDEQADVWYAVFDAVAIEPPPRLSCVLVTLTDIAKENLPYVLGRGAAGGPRGRLLQLAEESGIHPAPPPSLAPPPFNREPVESVAGMPTLHLGGPPVDNLAIDEEGTVTLIRLLGYSLLVGVVLSYLCFTSIKITVMVFVVGGSAAMLSMATVWWTGGKVDAILMSMPSLVYVMGLSGAIHVVNYYRDEVRHRGSSGAAGRAIRHAVVPCTLASLTTAIGLVSLFTSNLAPISNFGLYSAIGVMATLGVLFSYLPAALQTFPPSLHFAKEGKKASEKSASQEKVGQADRAEESAFAEAWASAGRWITSHHLAVTTVCLLVLFTAAMGLRHIKTSVQLLKLFDTESRIIRDYAWLEDHFGKLVPMEMIVRMPPLPEIAEEANELTDNVEPADTVTSLNMLERAEAVSRITTVVRRTLGETGTDVVGQTLSADTFLPPLPEPEYRWTSRRSTFNRRLLASRSELLDSDYIRIEKEGPFAGSELWRISLRVGALSDVDYGRFISTLRTAVEPVLRAYDTREAILAAMTRDAEGNAVGLSAKTRLLIIGHSRPESLDQAKLLAEDGETLDAEQIYLATLGELLAGVPMRTPGWMAEANVTQDSKQWQQAIANNFDAVVWVGDQTPDEATRTAIPRFIDARAIYAKSVTPILIDGNVPDVEGSGELQVVYTGAIPVVYKAQRTLLFSLVESIALAFVLIAGVMTLLLNPGRFPFGWFSPSNFAYGATAGMIAMIPNVFPVLLVFGVMCHRGIAIDIGTMMTASVAMGVAVDDTIHFLSWFRANLDAGLSRVEAVIETYRRVGPAMTQTTIVGGLGLFVFALSTFTPTQRFGVLMLVMLGAALVGDLVLLPALLAGPLGRFFKPRVVDPNPIPASDVGAVEDVSAEEDAGAEKGAGEGEDVGEKEGASSGVEGLHDETLPRLKVHFPSGRVDSPHRAR